MKLTYNNTTIDFEIQHERVLLSLSGGLDSASLMYLICTHFPDVTIIPFTGRDLNAPFDAECAADITQWMQDRFPNNKILEREEFSFDHNDPYWYQLAIDRWEDEFVLVNGERVPRCNRISGLSKMLIIRHETNKLKDKYPGSLLVSGMTSNPPIEEQKKHGFYDLAERRRDGPNKDKVQLSASGTHYQPFIHVDKKFVADIFKKNDLMKDLYPLTGSCIGTKNQTDYFTKECRQCFWCYEKKWAFDLEWD